MNFALPRLGFGGAPLGGLYAPVSQQQAHDTLQAAWDCGLRYFDTAPLYGYGVSEQRLGEFLRGFPREEFIVSTKAGRSLVPRTNGNDASGSLGQFHADSPYTAAFDFSADAIRNGVEQSLLRLKVETIDIVYLHDPDDHLDRAISCAFPALLKLREEGLVRAIGAGTNRTEPLVRLIEACDLDVVMLAGRYTLLDASAADRVLPLCKQRGVRVVAGGVFNSGILAQESLDSSATYDYQRAGSDLVNRARRVSEIAGRFGVGLRTAAIAFALRQPAIDSVVLGMRSAAEVRDNILAANTSVPEALWEALASESLLPQ
ncbi:MAG TPA: aldo/keto reductase [Candidatus Baltobacteraceae bacterium]|nr:aldo/keto reductase [Candidatus Baltobacteraceae bacterium]